MIDLELHGGKGGGEKPHQPVETPNNLISVAKAKVLIAVAEGELAGRPTNQDIFLDGTPLANPDGSLNFGGVKWEWRSGSVDQDYIQGLPEVSTEFQVGIELRDNAPWVRQITTPNLDAIRVTFNWPALLKSEENGDVVGYSMDYAIDLSIGGGAFNEYAVYNINGKTNTGYDRTHRIDLPPDASNIIVRARRITPDNQTGKVQDTINVKSYAEVIDVKQRYPNTALLYVEFDSRMFGGTAIPKVSVRTKGRILRVPSNYDPEARTYTGVWDGSFKQAWSNNPAWVYYDLVTNERFGLGHKVTPDMVDKFALYEISQYCDVLVSDGLGGLQPRHTCNIYIQQKSSAWKVLRDIASIFNGMTYWDGNKFVAVADKEEPTDNIAVFSRSNVVAGRFDYQAADNKSIYTSALVSYDDPDNHFGTEVEAVFEREQILRWGADRQTEMSAIGCTSRAEAQRKGRYTLLTNLYNRTVSFQTGLQGLNGEVLPGKLIHVVDPLIGGRQFTGRIKAATNTVITLDRDVQSKAGDILYLTKPNGQSEGRTVVSAQGSVVQVSTAYSVEIPPGSVWYLEAQDLKSQLYRVTKITSPSESVYEIEAVEYNASKYGAIDNGARLEPRPISVVPSNAQQAPKNVQVSSYNYVEQTMSINTMVINWDQTPNAVQYEVQWKVGEGDWVNAGLTGAPQLQIKGIYTGDYVARVRAINAIGIRSVWSSSQSTPLLGKTGAPPTLASLTTTSLLFGIRLDWAFKEGSSDTLYTQLRYSENQDFNQSRPLGDFGYPTDSHELHGLKAGQQFFFWGRLQDRSGNYGAWFPLESETGIEGRSLTNDDGAYNEYFAELISESALDKKLYDRIELIDGPANLAGSVNERVKNVNDRVDLTNEKLDEAVRDLNDRLTNIVDALVYDPTKTYVKGDVVRQGQKLYQAQKEVPLDTAPPDPEYWKDVGDIIESADGLAAQVELNTANIEEINGVIGFVASQVESITAIWREDDGEGDLQQALNTWRNRADITEERKVRADEDSALAERILTISAEAEDNKALIASLERAYADGDEALAERITTVEANTKTETDRLQAAITNEQKSRTDADTAFAEDIRQTGVSITNEKNAREAAIRDEQKARADADTAIGERITSVQGTITTESGRVDAAIREEQLARANEDGALGRRIDSVSASVTAEGKRTDGLIKTEQDARADGDAAQARRSDTIAASVTKESNDRAAAIKTVNDTIADNESATASRFDQLSSSFTDDLAEERRQRQAAITAEAKARSDSDGALATRLDTIEAGGVDFSEIEALIQEERTARVNGDEANAEIIQQVQTKADNNSVAIQNNVTATSNVKGQVDAAWTLKMEAYAGNQYVAAGIALGVGNEKGLLQSQFLVRADRFAVVNGTTATTVAPFVVQDGQVFIRDALIDRLFVGRALVGQTVESSAYTTWGQPNMRLRFDIGEIVTYHPNMPNTYCVFNTNGVDLVISGVRRVRMGVW